MGTKCVEKLGLVRKLRVMENRIDKMFSEQQNDIEKHNKPIFDFARTIRDVLTDADDYKNIAIGGSVGLYLGLGSDYAQDIRKVGDIDLYVFENDYDKACEVIDKLFISIGEEKGDRSIIKKMRENFIGFSKSECSKKGFCEDGFTQIYLETDVCKTDIKIDILIFGKELEVLCKYVSRDTGTMCLPFIIADKLFAAEWYYRHPEQIIDYKDAEKNSLFKNVNDILSALSCCNSISTDKFSVKLIGDVRKKWKNLKKEDINEIITFTDIKDFVMQINPKLKLAVKSERENVFPKE